MENLDENTARYLIAEARVKKLKALYIHAVVYVLVNLFIIAGNVQSGLLLTDMKNYWTPIFWGIGLLVHTISVFFTKCVFWQQLGRKKNSRINEKATYF
jgi:hypothetical protein